MHEVTFDLPPPVTPAARAQAFDAIADYIVRLPRAFKDEQPRRALGPIVRIADTTGDVRDDEQIDAHDANRIAAMAAIDAVVQAYLPAGDPGAALRAIEQIVLGRTIDAAAVA